MWLLLLLLSALALATEPEYASDPVAVKHAGRVCFTLYPTTAAHGPSAHLSVAHYESHAKQWRVDELAVASPGGPAGCFAVVKPGLYRAMRIRATLPPAAGAQGAEGAAEEPLVLVTGPVHYITAPPTTAPPTTTAVPTDAPDAAAEAATAQCACPCMTGAPECTTVNKCFGIYCGAHGGTCDAGSGQCVCPDEFTGPNCQTPACSWHGFYSPLTEQCVCRMGWGGYACQVCATPVQSGYQYICVPHVRAASNNAVAYLLMAVSAGDARDFLSGVKRADPQLPYHAIYPNTVGFDGQRYDCECASAASAADALKRRRGRFGPPGGGLGHRIDPGALDAYNATVVQCIENSNATAEQTSDMIGLWTTCVSFQQKGLLTDSWWIACIVLGIVALAELVAIIMGCVVWSFQARLWKELEMPNKIR